MKSSPIAFALGVVIASMTIAGSILMMITSYENDLNPKLIIFFGVSWSAMSCFTLLYLVIYQAVTDATENARQPKKSTSPTKKSEEAREQ